jgi:RNA polymerase-binding transcription factor DksA
MLNDDQLSRLRALLEEEREQLVQQLQELGVAEDGTARAFDENFADSGQVAAEQVENRTLGASLKDQLVEVDHALAKFDLGTYGVCEVSGEPIPFERLEAMPASRARIEFAG